MAIQIDRTFYTNKNYQKIPVLNSKGLNEFKDILDIELIDEISNEKFTLGQLLDNLIAENKKLKLDLDKQKDDYTQKYNVLLKIIENLKAEVREKGII